MVFGSGIGGMSGVEGSDVLATKQRTPEAAFFDAASGELSLDVLQKTILRL